MRRVWDRLLGRPCDHPHTLMVTSVGVRRIVCETCGHISFQMRPEDAPARSRGKARLKKAAGL